MVRLDPGTVTKAKGVEDFESSTLQAVSLSIENLHKVIRHYEAASESYQQGNTHLGASFVYDASFDPASCHPSRHHESGRACAYDKDINMGRLPRV